MRQRLAVAALTLAGLTAAGPALAIPAFERRYQAQCHFCHEGYPKLNAIGQRFKERGFRMQREEGFDAGAWLDSVPVAMRAFGTQTFLEEAEDATTGFFKALSAGNLGGRFSYWIDDAVLIQEGEDSFDHVNPDNLWLRFEVIEGGKLYARAGRIEMDLPFTQTRTPHLFSYDIYFANTGFEADNIGDHQDGVEIGGDLPSDFRWSAALVEGHNAAGAEELSDETGAFDANLFLRLSKRIARHRFGAFAYFGRNTLALSPDVVWDDDLIRLGLDANVWLDRLNLYGVFVYGSNNNPIATEEQPLGTQQELSYNGGFVQADFHARDNVALTLRLNLVSQPPPGTADSKQTYSGLFPGIQFWFMRRFKLSFEYGFLNQERPSFGALQAEVAF
jgi:hypothetical protein